MDNTARLVARVHCPHCTAGPAVAYIPAFAGWRCAGCGAMWGDVRWPR